MRGCAIPGPLKGLKGASIGQRDLIQGGLLMGKHRNSGPGHKRDVAKDRFPHNCSSVTVLPDGIRKDTAVDALSFKKWCSFLTVSVLRTRSPFFSFFTCFFALATELRSFGIASIPFAHSLSWDLYKKMPPGLSSAKRNRIHFRRALHVVVMGLNFWWAGNCFIPLELLERAPSPCQSRLVHRLASLMMADGPVGTFEVLRSGRRFHQLVARLSELSTAVTKLGPGASAYEKVYPGHDVPLDNSLFEELEPYRSLNASRLRVVGQRVFDATPSLSPELCMATEHQQFLNFLSAWTLWKKSLALQRSGTSVGFCTYMM